MDDVSPGTLAPTSTGPTIRELAGATRPVAVAGELLARLDVEHPALSGLPTRERLLAAAWLGSYRSARTRRAYAGDPTEGTVRCAARKGCLMTEQQQHSHEHSHDACLTSTST